MRDENNLPKGPLYIFQWTVPITKNWSMVVNPIPPAALAVPEVVEDLGDMSEANAVINRIRSL